MAAQKEKIKAQLDFENLRARLKLRSFSSERKLRQNHPLAARFFDAVGVKPGQIRHHATRLMASGALASSLLLAGNTPIQSSSAALSSPSTQHQTRPQNINDLIQRLRHLLPVEVGKLSGFAENQISQWIKETYGVDAKAQLEGQKLNDSYGRMGAEQHLPRYPGDTVYQHNEFQDKGITPGLGGWGYFARSHEQMTPELYDTEKYYVAVQTLYLPDWNTNTKFLAEWYKYRRVVVVNPSNGKAIVAAIADAGPSDWTGKKFGGSPEVMQYLGINYGMQNHPVVLFFLDDPEHKIKLGPL